MRDILLYRIGLLDKYRRIDMGDGRQERCC